MKKLAIITTHPIQYYAPVFQLLAKECKLKVFYSWGKNCIQENYDPDFKKSITWDIPLLEGYDYEFLENNSKNPGSHHFSGIKNPNAIEIIKKFNPDAILIYGWAYKSHLKILRRFSSKIPLWFRGDSNLLDEQKGLKKYFRSIFLKWVYKNISKAFYVGTANKKYYEAFGLKPKQLIFAPHAIDNNRFSLKQKEEAQKLRTSFNILPEEILILFAGKLEAKKNPEILLSTFLELGKSDVHLLFVGDGDLRTSLEMKVKKRTSLKKRVHFMDFQNQSQMPAIYQSCDLFCLPSKGPGETWGLAVNEAMAASKAILVSDHVGCAVDLVKENVNGRIFKSNNRTDLKSKLALMLNEKETLVKMGIQSKKIIKEWSIEKQAKIFIEQLNK